MTPGAYLKMRRTAAGLTLRDVVVRLSEFRRMAEHIEVEQLALIEADAQPARFSTINALLYAFHFDLHVLQALDGAAQGLRYEEPQQLCPLCGCHGDDLCWGPPDAEGVQDGCDWLEEPGLCSRCATLVAADRKYHASDLPASTLNADLGGEAGA